MAMEPGMQQNWNYAYGGYRRYMYNHSMGMGSWNSAPPQPQEFYQRMRMPMNNPSFPPLPSPGMVPNEGSNQTPPQDYYSKSVKAIAPLPSEMPPLPPAPPPPIIRENLPPLPPPLPSSENSFGTGEIRFRLPGKRPHLGISPLRNDSPLPAVKRKKKKKQGQMNRLKQFVRDSLGSLDAPDPANIPVPGEIQAPLPPTLMPTQPLCDPDKPINFPKSLERYINKCFQQATMDIDKDRVQLYLRGIITSVHKSGNLYTKDWDREPVPSPYSWKTNSQADNEVEFITSIPSPPPPPVISKNNMLTNKNPLLKPTMWVPASSPSPPPRSSSPKSHQSPRGKTKGFGRNKFRSDSSGSSKSRSRSRSPVRSSSKRRKSYRSESRKSTPQNRSNKRKQKPRKNNSFYTEGGAAFSVDSEMGSSERLQKRLARFSLESGSKKSQTSLAPVSLPPPPVGGFVVDDVENIDWTTLHIVGTCQDVEKKYFRLTSAPDPSIVRPIEVLKKSLDMVKRHWMDKRDYHFACDQLRSIRQDLTVQGVRDSFMIHVYETHARLAMESGDHEEFNQCQNQLKMLYADLGGKNMREFVSYRILYCIFTSNNMDMTTILASLSKEDKEDECIKFSLSFYSAWALKNYHKMFRVYTQSPRMCAYLIDWFLEKLRAQALKIMLKAFRQTLPVTFLQQELAFEKLDDARTFLDKSAIKYSNAEKSVVDCKASWSAVG